VLNQNFNLKNTFNIINLTLKINYKRMQMDRERKGEGREISWRSIIKGKTITGQVHRCFVCSSYFARISAPKNQLIVHPTSQQLVKTDLYWIVGVYGGVWATKKIMTNKTNRLAAKFFLLLQPKKQKPLN